MGDATAQGWRISQVETLTGLSRRDIQRSCDSNKENGGVGILQVDGSSWGRRTYTQRDLAALFMVAQYKRRGLTLPQAKEEFDRHGGEDGLPDMLNEELERLDDELANVTERYAKALALSAALRDDADELLGTLVDKLVAVARVERGACTADDLLAVPGIDLALELWRGPGTYEEELGRASA